MVGSDSAGLNRPHEGEARAADLATIRKLHQTDIDATMTHDLNALATLWSDDAVNPFERVPKAPANHQSR